jgi:predicted nucleic acid-binding protein
MTTLVDAATVLVARGIGAERCLSLDGRFEPEGLQRV